MLGYSDKLGRKLFRHIFVILKLLIFLGFSISISDFYIYEQPAAISRTHAPQIIR
jgi:hypothetical protein